METKGRSLPFYGIFSFDFFFTDSHLESGINVDLPKNACMTYACKIEEFIAVLHAGQGGDGGKGTGASYRCGR